MSRDVGILGGGLMGLVTAYLQARRGASVTVYERDAEVGGLLRSARIGDVQFDRYYHCILPGDRDLLWLLQELELRDRVAWRRTRAGFFHAGRLHSLDGLADFLRFPPLTPVQRLRLGWTIFRTARIRTWQEVDRIAVEDYLVRLGGRAVFERVWRPLLRAKLGDTYRETSAAFIWSTINRLYAARGTPDRSEKMGFLCGAYQGVLQRLRQRIEAARGRIRTGVSVRALEPEGGRLAVVTAEGRTAHDLVVSTIPPRGLAGLVRPLDAAYAGRLEEFRFHGVRTLVLLLDRPFSPYYVLNLTDLDTPVTGIVEVGNLAPVGSFGPGRSLLYLPLYTAPDSDAFREPAEGFRARCLRFLRRVRPDFDEHEIVGEGAFAAPSVLPIQTLGFGARVPGSETPIPGLHFAHNLQVYPSPLHNDAVVASCRRLDLRLAEGSG